MKTVIVIESIGHPKIQAEAIRKVLEEQDPGDHYVVDVLGDLEHMSRKRLAKENDILRFEWKGADYGGDYTILITENK